MATLNYHLIPRKVIDIKTRQERRGFIAKPIIHGKISFDQLCEQLSDGSTVDRADVKAVLSRMNVVIERNLKLGFSVDCGELGTFRPSFGSKLVETEEEFNVSLISKPRVVFTPRVAFKNSLRGVGFERSFPKTVHIGDPKKKRDEDAGGTPSVGGHSI